MNISKDQAVAILETMLKESASDFESGVLSYFDAIKREKAAVSALKTAVKSLMKANYAKYNALSIVLSEYGFITGKEEIKPPIENAEAIVAELIRKIVLDLDDEAYKNVVLSLTKEETNA